MKIIYVNEEKRARAENLLALVKGKLVPKTVDEQDAKTKFGAFLAEAKIATDSEDALPFIYEKLGGLIRTPAEQAKADKGKEDARKKAKRKMIE